MRRPILVAAISIMLVLSGNGFSQSSSASLSGTVSDAAKALIPGVTITATNVETGVISTGLTNESGTYNVPSLLPGVYKVTAELPGFQTQTFTDVRLGNAAQVRLNFTLNVASLNTTVEVTASAERLLLESTSSVGGVLPETTVQNLPVVGAMGNDVLTQVRTLPGLNLSSDLILAANDSKLAGVSAANVNIQRDGVDASAAGRWPAGIQSATIINPDLVGEVRMILSPVDAELGRGNAQIQVQTRSGTNKLRGAAVWNVRNSALDPNTWANKRVNGTPISRAWTNINQYTASVGGPIVKNKTFFFALYDGLSPVTKANTNATVLTPCARNGIFRYYDNWANGNALQVTTDASAATPRIAVVDQSGNPRQPATNPNGSPFTGQLRYASVFGPVTNIPTKPDCSDAIVSGAAWDPLRSGFDPTGYVTKMLGAMPAVNNWEVGDGLNTAGSRWTKRSVGGQNRFGFGVADARNQFNAKLDHNFNAKHKISGTWSLERVHADYATRVWPTGYDGVSHRQPQSLAINFVSTLSPTLLNEARWGMRRTGTNTIHGLANPATSKDALAFIPNVGGIPVLPQLGMKTTSWADTVTFVPLICVCGGQPNLSSEAGNLFNGNISESSPLYTYADNLTWTHGKHTFKGGAEARFASSRFGDDVDGNNWSAYARVFGGESALAPISSSISSTNIVGLQGNSTSGNNQAFRSLLSLLSGSLAQVTQLNWLSSSQNLDKFTDYRTSIQRIRQLNQKEASFFFKDDWKVSRHVTLNLGARWDYYGVPWVSGGLTAAPVGGGDALFGISGRGFGSWMKSTAGLAFDANQLTQLQFVGPDSPHSDVLAWPKDKNNFSPAIGFAWQIPWFGEGQTTLRGGYQVSYLSGGGRFNTINGPLANPPGSSYQAIFTGATGLEYLDMTKLSSIVPVPVAVKPMQAIPIEDRTTSLTAFDSNYTTPYVQNLTLAITRNVGKNVTLDTRYIGTLSRKLYDSVNLNSPDFLYNGLKDAFDAARAGGESALLDRMFQGINIAGTGLSGAEQLRRATASSIRNNLANGNYSALATTLSTLNYSKAGGINASLPNIPANTNGTVLRLNGFPENFIKTNPQFGTATLQTNMGSTNYHSLQGQVTLRQMAFISDFQAAYTWSKLLGRSGGYTNPVDRAGDYTLQPGDRRHDFRTNGTFQLPIGPRKLVAGKSSGIFARVIEGWQATWIVDLASGNPSNITAQSMLYANGVPDRVGSFDPSSGHVQWKEGALAGNYFGDAYHRVPDPQCARISPILQSANLCTLSAIADANGNIVLQNPLPGTRGNLGQNIIETPGTWTLDMSMGKGIKLTETKKLSLRMDATNILNHPQVSNPDLNINGSVPFGNIATKTGQRQFQAQLRLDF
jgi:Carboxypeptidase regulatory-like domain